MRFVKLVGGTSVVYVRAKCCPAHSCEQGPRRDLEGMPVPSRNWMGQLTNESFFTSTSSLIAEHAHIESRPWR
jgi:hypothetical protein